MTKQKGPNVTGALNGAQPQGPRRDSAYVEKTFDSPRILGEARDDLVRGLRAHDQENVAGTLERASDDHEALSMRAFMNEACGSQSTWLSRASESCQAGPRLRITTKSCGVFMGRL